MNVQRIGLFEALKRHQTHRRYRGWFQQPGGLLGESSPSSFRHAVSAEIVNIAGGLVTVKISGLLTFPEFTGVEHVLDDFLRRYPGPRKVRILAILEDFRGWAREGDWGDTTFLDEHDPFIERIAVVGEKRWEESVLGFNLKGLRKAAVEYFQPQDLEKAQAWVA